MSAYLLAGLGGINYHQKSYTRDHRAVRLVSVLSPFLALISVAHDPNLTEAFFPVGRFRCNAQPVAWHTSHQPQAGAVSSKSPFPSGMGAEAWQEVPLLVPWDLSCLDYVSVQELEVSHKE